MKEFSQIVSRKALRFKQINFNICFGVIALTSFAFANFASAQANVSFPNKICNVKDFGAMGAKLKPDTVFFQAAIDTCSAAGGGTVVIPRGWYLVGPIDLKSNVRINFEKYSEVRFETEPSLYGTTKAPVSPEGKWADKGLINITDASNVAITGEGLIDGQGNVWWEWIRDYWRVSAANTSGKANQGQKVTRPRLILAKNSQNILIEKVSLFNAPSFHIVLNNSDNITIRNTKIYAPGNSPNTDGIDPTGSRNVLIENNDISLGDDIIAIKGTGFDPKFPDAVTKNIIVRNNTIREGHGISIGSGTYGGVKNVLIENNSFDGSLHGFRIKTRRKFGGEVSQIVFRNNTMKNVRNVLTVSSYFAYAPIDEIEAVKQIEAGGFMVLDLYYPPETEPAQPFVKNETPDVYDVTIENLKATGAENIGLIIGLPEKSIRNLKMINVNIESENGLLIRHADVTVTNVNFKVKNGENVKVQNGGKFSKKPKSK